MKVVVVLEFMGSMYCDISSPKSSKKIILGLHQGLVVI